VETQHHYSGYRHYAATIVIKFTNLKDRFNFKPQNYVTMDKRQGKGIPAGHVGFRGAMSLVNCPA